MTVFKKLCLGLGATLAAALCAGAIWTALPVTPAQDKPDPSVIHANAQNKGGPEFTEAYFEHAGKRLHYVEAGSGEVVLFLHGFPSYWYSLIRPMQALKNDYRVVAIDGLGKGLSDVSTDLDDYKLANMVEHIERLIDHLGENRVHLVGHDWGHGLAFALAAKYPERVKSLTGMSAPPQSVMLELVETNSAQRDIFSYVDYFKRAHPLLLAALDVEQQIYDGSFAPLVEAGQMTTEEGQLFRQEASNPKKVQAHINWYKANLPDFDNITDDAFWPKRKARVEAPLLFIWGTDDIVVTADTVAELRSVSSEFTELKLEGVGHRPQFERADEVIDALYAHIGKHSS